MNAERLLQHYDRIADAPNAIPRLRSFILDLAVRGKLVPQDSADEPASELLKRIAKEKARLVKAGLARKSDIDPISDEEAPFPVPTNWEWTRLGSIADWGSGSTPPRGNLDLYGGGITWLKSGELNDNRALVGSEETVSQLAIEKGSFRLNRPGDVLIAMYGATIGKVAILAETAVTNQAVCGCTPFEGVFNQFLFLYLLSQREQFHLASEGGAQPNISKVKIVWSPFPLPPLPEQHRIVAKVDELMGLCDQLEAARKSRETTRDRLAAATLTRLSAPDPETFLADTRFALNALPALTVRPDQIDRLRHAVLNLAVRGKLAPQDSTEETASELLMRIREARKRKTKDGTVKREVPLGAVGSSERPFDIPANWEWVRLNELTELVYGKLLPTSELLDAGYDVFGANGIIGKYSRYLYAEPMLLISCRGAYSGTPNISPPKAFVTNNSIVCELFDPSCLSIHYLHLVLSVSPRNGVVTGTAQPQVTIANAIKLPVPLPPLAEQHRIVANVGALTTLCDRLETSLTKSANTRRLLLEAVLAEALAPAGPVQLEAAE